MESVEILMCIDKSGSMGPQASTVVDQFNNFIAKQKEIPGECYVTIWQFNSKVDKVEFRTPLGRINYLSYWPNGGTALYDAVGNMINYMGKVYAEMPVPPKKVIMVIITDGYENSSLEFRTPESVQKLVDHQKDKYSWEFIFLGSGIDAAKEGNAIGVINTFSVPEGAIGTRQIYDITNSAVLQYRQTGSINYKDIDNE